MKSGAKLSKTSLMNVKLDDAQLTKLLNTLYDLKEYNHTAESCLKIMGSFDPSESNSIKVLKTLLAILKSNPYSEISSEWITKACSSRHFSDSWIPVYLQLFDTSIKNKLVTNPFGQGSEQVLRPLNSIMQAQSLSTESVSRPVKLYSDGKNFNFSFLHKLDKHEDFKRNHTDQVLKALLEAIETFGSLKGNELFFLTALLDKANKCDPSLIIHFFNLMGTRVKFLDKGSENMFFSLLKKLIQHKDMCEEKLIQLIPYYGPYLGFNLPRFLLTLLDASSISEEFLNKVIEMTLDPRYVNRITSQERILKKISERAKELPEDQATRIAKREVSSFQKLKNSGFEGGTLDQNISSIPKLDFLNAEKFMELKNFF